MAEREGLKAVIESEVGRVGSGYILRARIVSLDVVRAPRSTTLQACLQIHGNPLPRRIDQWGAHAIATELGGLPRA